MKRIKRTSVIKGITFIAVVAFILFATALDSGGWIPIVVCAICAVWLLLVAIANGE